MCSKVRVCIYDRIGCVCISNKGRASSPFAIYDHPDATQPNNQMSHTTLPPLPATRTFLTFLGDRHLPIFPAYPLIHIQNNPSISVRQTQFSRYGRNSLYILTQTSPGFPLRDRLAGKGCAVLLSAPHLYIFLICLPCPPSLFWASNPNG